MYIDRLNIDFEGEEPYDDSVIIVIKIHKIYFY